MVCQDGSDGSRDITNTRDSDGSPARGIRMVVGGIGKTGDCWSNKDGVIDVLRVSV